MKYTKLLSAVFLASLAIDPAGADEPSYGIGAEVNDNFRVYVPITVDQYVIEPSLLIYSDHEKSTDNASIENDDFDAVEINIGFYKKDSVTDGAYIYYGAKIGYKKQEQKSEFGASVGKTKVDGYLIAPTIGAEYYFTNRFSLGLEISFQYENTDGTRTSTYLSSSDVTDVETTAYHTLADVIVRYRF